MRQLWKLRQLGKIAALRRFAYWAMSLRFRDGSTTLIARGPLQGLRWINSSRYQFWMPHGTYEPETAQWMTEHITSDSVVLDVGANAGYFTLLAARLVGGEERESGTGAVIAFEPLADNCRHISDMLALNDLRATVEPVALSNIEGAATFIQADTNANSRLADFDGARKQVTERSSTQVSTTTIDAWIAETGMQPTVIKVDIEGAEVAFLQGATNFLDRGGPATMLISTHSPELCQGCGDLLEVSGWEWAPLAGFEHEIIAKRSTSQRP